MLRLKRELIKISMEAEIENYNNYAMIGVCQKIKELAQKYGYETVWEFLRTTRGCPFRLYAEFAYRYPSFEKSKISYNYKL